MSLSVLLSACLDVPYPEPSVSRDQMIAPETGLTHAADKMMPGLVDCVNYGVTATREADWNPAKQPMMNAPEFARTLVWANAYIPEVFYRKLGYVKDETAGVRNVEDVGHIQSYFGPIVPPGVNAAVHTVPATPGFVALPRNY